MAAPDDIELEVPPVIAPANPMPMDWEDRIPRHRELWEKAEAQHYDPNADVDWDAFDPKDFSDEERVAIAYWFATNSVFENSGVPTFGLGMVKAYEDHLGDSTARMLLTIARDESNHDEMSRRVVERLLPGFPNRFEPSTPLERAAKNNLDWVQYTNSRYWGSYKDAFAERSLPAVMSNFVVGEAAASLIFVQTSKNARHPTFEKVLRNIGVDEARHFACFNYMAQHAWGGLSDEDRAALTKNLKASYIYISVVFGDARPPFWKVPSYFHDSHDRFQAAARDAGVGLIPREERDDIWRKAMLRVKAISDRYGIEWPAIEELGIDGKETPLSEDDLVVVSF